MIENFKWMNKLAPKVAKYKKFFSLQQNQDGHARLNVDFDGLVENLPDFPGSDLVKHGFKSFFNQLIKYLAYWNQFVKRAPLSKYYNYLTRIELKKFIRY